MSCNSSKHQKNRKKILVLGSVLSLSLGLLCLSQARAQPGPPDGMFEGHGHKLEAALAKLDLRADQKQALKALRTKVETGLGPMRKLKAETVAEVVRGVRRGTLDSAKLTQLASQASATWIKVRPVVTSGLNELHGILDANQRQEFVDQLKAGRMGHRGRHGHGKAMLKNLDLSDDQEDRIMDGMWQTFRRHRGEMRQKGRELKGQMKEAAQAFVGERFDASRLALFNRAELPFQKMSQGLAEMAQVVLPVLDAAQREKLATLIETRAAAAARATDASSSR